MKRTVIILGGGKGLRVGCDLPKQFIPLRGKPILMHTMEVFYQWDTTMDVVLVLPEEYTSYWGMLCKELNFSMPHRIVLGGETRFHSVYNALHTPPASINSQFSFVAVHDGVRPFVSPAVISSCFKMAEEYGAAISVIPVIDTVRELDGADNRTFDRNRLCIVHTPQVFRADILLNAYEQPYEKRFTDDASLVEASGHPIHLIEGNYENIKITTPVDLQYASILIENINS